MSLMDSPAVLLPAAPKRPNGPNFDFRYTSRSRLNSDIAPCPFRAMNGLVGSIILAPLDVTADTKKKGRLRCHKRPSLGRKRPKRACAATTLPHRNNMRVRRTKGKLY